MGTDGLAQAGVPFCAWCLSTSGPFFVTKQMRVICEACVQQNLHESEPKAEEAVERGNMRDD